MQHLIKLYEETKKLNSDLSVNKNLIFYADIHGMSRAKSRQKIDELLTRFKLNDFRKYKAHNLIWVFYACRGEFTLDFRGKLRHGPLVPSPCR